MRKYENISNKQNGQGRFNIVLTRLPVLSCKFRNTCWYLLTKYERCQDETTIHLLKPGGSSFTVCAITAHKACGRPPTIQ